MSKKQWKIGCEASQVRGVLRRIRELGDAGHLPDRTRERLIRMTESVEPLVVFDLREGKRSYTLVVRPSYELKRILGRLEARAAKAAP